MMLYHFSRGSNRMFSEREKRLIFWGDKKGSEKKEVKGGAEKEKQPTDAEKIEQLMTEVKQLREMLEKRESQATNIVNSSYAPRVGPDGRLQLPPDISGHPCMNTDACRGYVIDGQRSRYGLMPVHAALRARNRAARRGYRRSSRVRGPSSGGTIESVQDPDAQARMWEIRRGSQDVARNRVTGRMYRQRDLEGIRNFASWRKNGTQMYNHMYASRDLAREMGIEGWGKAPTSYNDAMFVGHQERLGLTGSMPMGYGSNNYRYMENPWMKRGGFDSKGRPIDRQGAFRNYLMKSGYVIPPRPRGGGGGSVNEYWDAVNHDRLNNGEFDDLKGDPKYEEMMKMYRRRLDFGMDDNPKYYVHEFETLRRLRKGAQRMDAEIPQEKVIYTHSIENNSELGYGYATITLEDKIDLATGRPKVITLRDIRSNRVGEVDLSFGKSTGLIFENGIRITTNRYDKGATGSDYNRYGNISGFNFGFTQPGTYTIRYRSRAGQGQEGVDRITINQDGTWRVENGFTDAPAGAAQKNPGKNTNSSKLDNSRKNLFTSEPPEASTPLKANEAQTATIIKLADEFNLVHRNRAGLYSQVQRVDGSITIYARKTGAENWTRIDINPEGKAVSRSIVEVAATEAEIAPPPPGTRAKSGTDKRFGDPIPEKKPEPKKPEEKKPNEDLKDKIEDKTKKVKEGAEKKKQVEVNAEVITNPDERAAIISQIAKSTQLREYSRYLVLWTKVMQMQNNNFSIERRTPKVAGEKIDGAYDEVLHITDNGKIVADIGKIGGKYEHVNNFSADILRQKWWMESLGKFQMELAKQEGLKNKQWSFDANRGQLVVEVPDGTVRIPLRYATDVEDRAPTLMKLERAGKEAVGKDNKKLNLIIDLPQPVPTTLDAQQFVKLLENLKVKDVDIPSEAKSIEAELKSAAQGTPFEYVEGVSIFNPQAKIISPEMRSKLTAEQLVRLKEIFNGGEEPYLLVYASKEGMLNDVEIMGPDGSDKGLVRPTEMQEIKMILEGFKNQKITKEMFATILSKSQELLMQKLNEPAGAEFDPYSFGTEIKLPANIATYESEFGVKGSTKIDAKKTYIVRGKSKIGDYIYVQNKDDVRENFLVKKSDIEAGSDKNIERKNKLVKDVLDEYSSVNSHFASREDGCTVPSKEKLLSLDEKILDKLLNAVKAMDESMNGLLIVLQNRHGDVKGYEMLKEFVQLHNAVLQRGIDGLGEIDANDVSKITTDVVRVIDLQSDINDQLPDELKIKPFSKKQLYKASMFELNNLKNVLEIFNENLAATKKFEPTKFKEVVNEFNKSIEKFVNE